MNKTRIHLAVAGLLLAGSGLALAQQAAPAAPAAAPAPSTSAVLPNSSNVLSGNLFEASGIPVEQTRKINPIRLSSAISLYADTGIDLGYDSNVTQARKGSEVSSSFFRVTPTLALDSQYRSGRYTLSYKGDYVRYPSYNPNSLAQNDLIFQAQNVFTTRSALAWGASVGDHYDPIGSTDRNLNGSEADHYHTMAANATYAYGAESAQGRLEFDGGVGSKRYQNNRAWTESADVDNTNLAARFFYRVAPKTRALAEVRRTTYDYVSDLQRLDNTDWRTYLGATWDASSALTGTVKVGEQFKNYRDTDAHRNYKGFSWEAAVRWTPRTYSSFDLSTGRAANDPSGNTGSPVTKSVMLAWNHDWTSYVHSKLSLGQMNTDYSGTGRKDTDRVAGVGVMYDMRRWLGLGLEYTWSKRNSNEDNYDYVRNVTMFKVEASF